MMYDEDSESVSSSDSVSNLPLITPNMSKEDKLLNKPMYYKGKIFKGEDYWPYKNNFRPSVASFLKGFSKRESVLDPNFENFLNFDHKTALQKGLNLITTEIDSFGHAKSLDKLNESELSHSVLPRIKRKKGKSLYMKSRNAAQIRGKISSLLAKGRHSGGSIIVRPLNSLKTE